MALSMAQESKRPQRGYMANPMGDVHAIPIRRPNETRSNSPVSTLYRSNRTQCMARGYRGPRDTPVLPLRLDKPNSLPHSTMVPPAQQTRPNSTKHIGTYKGDPREEKEYSSSGTMANRSWDPPDCKRNKQGGHNRIPPIPIAGDVVKMEMK